VSSCRSSTSSASPVARRRDDGGVILIIMGSRGSASSSVRAASGDDRFTMGIAVVIGALQLRDVLGSRTDCRIPTYARISRCAVDLRGSFNYWESASRSRRSALGRAAEDPAPDSAPLVALTVVAIGVALMYHFAPGSWHFHIRRSAIASAIRSAMACRPGSHRCRHPACVARARHRDRLPRRSRSCCERIRESRCSARSNR